MMKPKAYKSGVKPIWCPGCGHYSVLNAITKALSVLDQNCLLYTSPSPRD